MRNLLLIASAVLVAAPARGEIAWRPDLATAHAEAVRTGKLLLVHFYSDDCVWCERLEQGAYREPSIAAAIESQFVPVGINGKREPMYATEFGISSYPTEVIVAPDDGKILSHMTTPQDVGQYIAMLRAPAVADRIARSMPAATAFADAGSGVGGVRGLDRAQVPASAASDAVASGMLGLPTSAKHNPQVAGPGPEMAGMAMPAGIAGGNFDMPSYSGAAAASGAGFFGGTPAVAAGYGTGGRSFAGLAPPANSAAAEDDHDAQPQEGSADPLAADEPKATPQKNAKQLPPEAMEGYCAVTVIEERRWERGNPEFGVIHLGQLYLFTDAAAKKKFQASPDRYTPVLNGIDVVKFFDQREVVQGSREWGFTDPLYDRMFLFADEASMNHFYLNFNRYTEPAIELMDRAAAEANPSR